MHTLGSGFSISSHIPNWGDYQAISQWIALETINYFENNSQLVDENIKHNLDSIKQGGWGFEPNPVISSPTMDRFKCEPLQKIINNYAPYIIVVKDLYNKVGNDILYPAMQLMVTEEFIAVDAEGHSILISSKTAKSILKISEKAMNILEIYKNKNQQAVQEEQANEQANRIYNESTRLVKKEDKSCCTLL